MLSHVPSMDAAYLTIFFPILIFLQRDNKLEKLKKKFDRILEKSYSR